MKKVVVKFGGKQYLVAEGDKIKVDRLTETEGQEFTVNEVLAVIDGEKTKVGTPTVKQAVTVKLLANLRAKKVLVEKFKSKKRYHRTKGHRQHQSQVQITKIA